MNTLATLPLRTKIFLAVTMSSLMSVIIAGMFFMLIQQFAGQTLDAFHQAMDHIAQLRTATSPTAIDPSTIEELKAVFEATLLAQTQRITFMILAIVGMTVVLAIVTAVVIARGEALVVDRVSTQRIEDMTNQELAQLLERISRTLRTHKDSKKEFFRL